MAHPGHAQRRGNIHLVAHPGDFLFQRFPFLAKIRQHGIIAQANARIPGLPAHRSNGPIIDFAGDGIVKPEGKGHKLHAFRPLSGSPIDGLGQGHFPRFNLPIQRIGA